MQPWVLQQFYGIVREQCSNMPNDTNPPRCIATPDQTRNSSSISCLIMCKKPRLLTTSQCNSNVSKLLLKCMDRQKLCWLLLIFNILESKQLQAFGSASMKLQANCFSKLKINKIHRGKKLHFLMNLCFLSLLKIS